MLRGKQETKSEDCKNQALKGRTSFGLWARNLQSPKASALSVLECTNVLKGQKTALKDDSVVEEITSKVMTCASKIRLKIVTDDVSIP